MIALLSCAVLLSAQQIKVLSDNIHHGEGADGKLDLPRSARVIQSVDPDLVAVQEVDLRTKRANGVDQAAELARPTRMHEVFGRTIDHQGGWYGNLLLSRWHVRGFTVQACEFRIFATHLDITEKDRLLAAERLPKRIAELPAGSPMILAGDFNAAPGSPAFKALSEHWTIDPEAKPTTPADKPGKQIDFVAFRPRNRWKIISTRVLDEPVASDHRPILMTLEPID